MKFTDGFMIQNLYFSVFLLAIIVFFDVLFKFKSPLLLKLYFLLTIICSAVTSLFSLIASDPDQYVVQILIFKGIAGISVVQIFTLLYFQKYKNVINGYSIFTLLYLMVLSYYSLTDKAIIPKYDSVTNIMDQREFDFNLPVFGNALSYIYLISSNLIFVFYIYFILFRYSFDNIYFRKIQKWTIALFFLLAILLSGFVISLFFARTHSVYHYLSIGVTFYILLLILYRPSFINKNGFKISFGQAFNKNPISEIRAEIFEYQFFSNFYYKNKEASISDFANILGVSKELMFNYVYHTYSMNFDELINKNRIAYFVEIIKDPKFKNYTVEALALEVGFSSRQRFYQPFKKYHGGNPSDLIDVFND